ncbi:hypothetical protein [Dapis sp. BLCC M229]
MIEKLITALSQEVGMSFQLSVISYQLSVFPFECYLYLYNDWRIQTGRKG